MFNELKYHNGQAYVVKRKLSTHNFVFKNGQIEMRAVQMYMEHINCDFNHIKHLTIKNELLYYGR